jgi:hypothetical protein
MHTGGDVGNVGALPAPRCLAFLGAAKTHLDRRLFSPILGRRRSPLQRAHLIAYVMRPAINCALSTLPPNRTPRLRDCRAKCGQSYGENGRPRPRDPPLFRALKIPLRTVAK